MSRTYQVYVKNEKTGRVTRCGGGAHMTHESACAFKRAHEVGREHMHYYLHETTHRDV